MADELDGGGSLLHKYRILGKAGEGTFSEVLKAWRVDYLRSYLKFGTEF